MVRQFPLVSKGTVTIRIIAVRIIPIRIVPIRISISEPWANKYARAEPTVEVAIVELAAMETTVEPAMEAATMKPTMEPALRLDAGTVQHRYSG
jgi:hypothetical protein